MKERCDTIEEKIDAHIRVHQKDHTEDMAWVHELKSDIKILSHKFDDYLEENNRYRRERKIEDDKWRETMSPLTDAWTALKWVFGAFLAIGGLALLAKNLFMK